MKRIVTVVGARPQFIKAAAVNRAMSRRGETEIDHFLLHTGQHYDDNVSSVFFRELELPEADANLGICGGTHGAMTGAMLAGIEKLLMRRRPDGCLCGQECRSAPTLSETTHGAGSGHRIVVRP